MLRIYLKKNYKDVIKRLKYLNSKFNFKHKIIFETGSTDTFVKNISDLGYHVSYYMPTNEVLTLIHRNDKANTLNYFKELNIQLKTQKVNAISFDVRLYEFIKLNAPENFTDTYHLWDLGLSLKDLNF